MTKILSKELIGPGTTFEQLGLKTNFSFKIEQRSSNQFYWTARKNGLLTYAASGTCLHGHKSFQESLDDLRAFITDYPNLFRA